MFLDIITHDQVSAFMLLHSIAYLNVIYHACYLVGLFDYLPARSVGMFAYLFLIVGCS